MTDQARVYGGSLYDLAAEERLTDVIREQMLVIKQLFRDNPDYVRLLSEPSVKRDERLDLIEKAFGTSCERYLVSFLKLLVEHNILNEYEGCCDIFAKRYNADNNIADAVVTSAVALNAGQLEQLSRKLQAISGKQVSLTQKIDTKVLAGIKVELEGKQLDGTVKGRLAGMSEQLSEIIM